MKRSFLVSTHSATAQMDGYVSFDKQGNGILANARVARHTNATCYAWYAIY